MNVYAGARGQIEINSTGIAEPQVGTVFQTKFAGVPCQCRVTRVVRYASPKRRGTSPIIVDVTHRLDFVVL